MPIEKIESQKNSKINCKEVHQQKEKKKKTK